MPINVELTRFKVKPGKKERVEQWMRLLNDHMSSVLLTLNEEKMYVETIFREEINGTLYLYWYSIQGEGGIAVQESNHEIDKMHLKFWEECIDASYSPIDLKPEVVMIQEIIQNNMK